MKIKKITFKYSIITNKIKTMNWDKFGVWILGILIVMYGFFSPILLLIYTIVSVVIFDNVTAILREWSLLDTKGYTIWEKIMRYFRCVQSSGIRKTILKLVLYCLSVMLFYLVEISIFSVSLYIHKLIGAMILLTELKSISENMDIALKTNTFTRYFNLFRDKTIEKINQKIDDEKNNS